MLVYSVTPNGKDRHVHKEMRKSENDQITSRAILSSDFLLVVKFREK